jgi:hypothetical protein
MHSYEVAYRTGPADYKAEEVVADFYETQATQGAHMIADFRLDDGKYIATFADVLSVKLLNREAACDLVV